LDANTAKEWAFLAFTRKKSELLPAKPKARKIAKRKPFAKPFGFDSFGTGAAVNR
jgi:hypothetical protein